MNVSPLSDKDLDDITFLVLHQAEHHWRGKVLVPNFSGQIVKTKLVDVAATKFKFFGKVDARQMEYTLVLTDFHASNYYDGVRLQLERFAGNLMIGLIDEADRQLEEFVDEGFREVV